MTKEEIVEVLADLYRITGFRVSLHAADYSEIAAYPKPKCELCKRIQEISGERDRCINSDRVSCKAAIDKRGAHIYKCRHGMTEAVSPLYNFGTLTGFLMMGQVYDCTADKSDGARRAEELGIPGDDVRQAQEKIPVVSADMIPSFVRIMTICAQYLTVSHAIPSNRPTVAHLAKEYISLHFRTKISIDRICKEVGCSKSALISAFKREYGTTVNPYVTDVRLNEALHMLRQGEHKVGEISELCGFSDQSYFSKVFSQKYGVPPTEWRQVAEESYIPF